MNAPVTASFHASSAHRVARERVPFLIDAVGEPIYAVPAQHADQTFPSVLVTGTLGAAISVAGVWVTAVLAM